MSFQQGLSGLNASAKALDVLGNNIANANTVGFKSAEAHFGDVFANSLAGAGAAQVGIGVGTSAIVQQFSQGNVTATNNPLDMAINGGGFYRMISNGTVTYSRNGQFHLDKSGYIVDDRSRVLSGYKAGSTGEIIQASPEGLRLDNSDQSPVATGTGVGSFQGVKATINYDSRSIAPASATPPAPWVAGVNHDPSTYNWSTAVSIYDSLGNPHTLSLYAVKTATSGLWDIHAAVDGTTDANVTLGTPTLQFTSSGQLDSAIAGNGIVNVSIDLDTVMTDSGKVNSATTPLVFDIDFGGSTQFGSSFGANRLEQDGYASGRLSGSVWRQMG